MVLKSTNQYYIFSINGCEYNTLYYTSHGEYYQFILFDIVDVCLMSSACQSISIK